MKRKHFENCEFISQFARMKIPIIIPHSEKAIKKSEKYEFLVFMKNVIAKGATTEVQTLFHMTSLNTDSV